MRLVLIVSIACFIVAADRAESQSVRGAFPSPSVQILPMLLAQDRGFYKREGLDLELVFVRGASTAVQAAAIRFILFFPLGRKCPRCGKATTSCFWRSRWAAQLFPWW
jgi:hypothetical protein